VVRIFKSAGTITLMLSAVAAHGSLSETGQIDADSVNAAARSKAAATYSPYVGRDYPDQVLFGDAHFHTNLSPDAGLLGTTIDVDTAYRFARGEKVLSNTG
jgi:hypothetical protein